jgi:hypothetical protein
MQLIRLPWPCHVLQADVLLLLLAVEVVVVVRVVCSERFNNLQKPKWPATDLEHHSI